MSDSGSIKGKSHKKGGVPMRNKGTGQEYEVEGGEFIICKKAMQDRKKRRFYGTNKEIVSKINLSATCNPADDYKSKTMKKGGNIPAKRIKTPDITANYYRVRVRDPKGSTQCRVPDWAETVAESVQKGSKITTCKWKGEWAIQSVLIPKRATMTKQLAKNKATTIVNKVEARGGGGKIKKAKGGYVAIAERTSGASKGWITIMSKPTTREGAEKFKGAEMKNEKFKVMKVEDVEKRKNVLGKEYLSKGGGIKGGNLNGRGVPPVSYMGKSGEYIWNRWNSRQRWHFLADHDRRGLYSKHVNKNWGDLPQGLKDLINFHVQDARYGGGGSVKKKAKGGGVETSFNGISDYEVSLSPVDKAMKKWLDDFENLMNFKF